MLSRYYIAEPIQKHRTSPPGGPFLIVKAVLRRTSAHIRAFRFIFYCKNSYCISICFMLSFFVLSRTPFEIFDPTFPGAALPAPCPIASWLLRTQRQLFAISISNRIINLHTPRSLFALSCKLSPFLSLRCALLPKNRGVYPSPPFPKTCPPVFSTTYVLSGKTHSPSSHFRFTSF